MHGKLTKATAAATWPVLLPYLCIIFCGTFAFRKIGEIDRMHAYTYFTLLKRLLS